MYLLFNSVLFLAKLQIAGHSITLDPRLPFPDSVGGIFPGPATIQRVYHGIECFSQLAATMNDSFEHVD